MAIAYVTRVTLVRASDVEFRLLGPLEVLRDGHPVRLGGPKERALLALLLIGANRPVSTDRLFTELWGESAPASASVSLRSWISRLRKALRDPDRIATRAPGYMLSVQPGEVDAERFLRLVAAARAAAASERASALREALSLWRGPALEDVAASSSVCAAEAARLDEARMAAVEDRIAADLECGRHADLTGELEALLTGHPLRERLWGQLMLALYRSGRQAEALAAYERVRERLADELGVDPSPELRAVHASILRQEPFGSVVAATAAEDSGIIGRREELAAVASLLGRSRLVTLVGAGGTGKTTLARALPGAPVWAELAPVPDDGDVAAHVAGSLGLVETPGRSPADAIADRLGDADVLLVLDNCEHVVAGVARLVVRLLEACPRLRIVATSREALGVEAEHRFAVPPLSLEPGEDGVSDAVRLFERRARRARSGFTLSPQDRDVVDAICRRLDGLPLAVELAAARVDVVGVRDIERRLGLDLLADPGRERRVAHRTMRAAIGWSYDSLDEPHRAVLRRASVFPGGFSLDDAEIVCAGDGVGEADVLRTVSRLAAVSLVSVRHGDGSARFEFLEPVRAFASERLDGAGEGDAVRARLVSLALDRASGTIDPDDRDTIRAALSWTCGADPDAARTLAVAFARHLLPRGMLAEARRWLEAAAPGLGDAEGQLELGRVCLAQGDVAAAAVALERARDAGDELTSGRAVVNLAGVALLRSDPKEAHDLLEQGLQAAEGLDDDALRIAALQSLGRLSWQASRFDEAEARFDDALARARHAGDDDQAARVLLNLGELARTRGERERAALLLTEALDRARAGDHPQVEAAVLGAMGNVADAMADPSTARRRFEECLTLARSMADTRLVASTLANLGSLAERSGDLDAAAAAYTGFVTAAGRLGDRRWVARAQRGLADVLRRRGDLGRAARTLAGALSECVELGERDRVCACIESAAEIALARGDERDAASMLAAATRLRVEIGVPRDLAEEHAFQRLCGALEGIVADDVPDGEAEAYALAWLGRASVPAGS